jgi:hypothetical protein
MLRPGALPLDAADNKNWVQEVLGTFRCCAQAVDSTMLAAIGTLVASQQSQGTSASSNMVALAQLLNCAATHPNASLLFTTSKHGPTHI